MLYQTAREAVGNLIAAKQRSILALIGIVIGTGAVIAMINVGSIARNETARQFKEMGTDILAVQASGATGSGEMRVADIDALPSEVPAVLTIAPLVIGGGDVRFHAAKASPMQVATTESFSRLARLRVHEGRFLSPFDHFDMYCVLGSGLAATLSNGGAPIRINDQITIGRYVFTVIGMLEPAFTSPLIPVDINSTLFISMANAKRIIPPGQITTMVARVAPGFSADAASVDILTYFKPKLRTTQLRVQSAQQLLAGMDSQMRLFTLLLGATGSIALVLGGVGVMNLMLVSVSERRREIGVRLAIGARRRNIQTLFLSESLALSITGGIIGIGVGAIAAWGFARYSHWEFFFEPSSALIGTGVSMAVGIFFGFYPAMMASRLDPIEALRSE